VGEESIIRGGFLQPSLIDDTEHPQRILAGCLPEIAVQSTEKLDGLVAPCPTEVEGKIMKALDSFRQGRHNAKISNGSHFD
jgi:hypothetical protein